MATQTIFTLNARENVFLDLASQSLLPVELNHGIWGLHETTVEILEEKGLAYAALKSALVPSLDRYEAGFVFDTREIDSNWYGRRVFRELLPLLDPRSSHSFLCGDLLGRNQAGIFQMLRQSMVPARSFEFTHSHVLYCVYVNNLTEAMLTRLHLGLSALRAYVGFLDVTFACPAKTYLSTILNQDFLKFRKTAVMAHEDDRSNSEDINLRGHPFEDFGYSVRSLQEMYFNLFLSYKIERAVHPGFESDSDMSLTALVPNALQLGGLAVQIDEQKHRYLRTEKAGKLQKAGIAGLDRDQLATLIKAKIKSNYIYNLTVLEDYSVAKFDLMIEVPREGGYPTRLVAALEYQPEKQSLRLITLH